MVTDKKKKEREEKKTNTITRVPDKDRMNETITTTLEQENKGLSLQEQRARNQAQIDLINAQNRTPGLSAKQALEAKKAEETALQQEAQKLEEAGGFKETPQEAVTFSTDTNRAQLEGQAPLSPVNILGKIPGVAQMIQTASSDYGLTEDQLNEFRALNPEIADEYEGYFLDIAIERKNRDFVNKFTDNLGALAEGIKIGGLAGSIGFSTPSGKIKDIRGNLGKTDTFVDTQVQMADTNPYQALENLNRVEEETKRLEARLQILILESRSTQTNTEEIDAIRKEIDIAYNKIGRGRDEIVAKAGFQAVEDTSTKKALILKKIEEAQKDLNT